MLALYLSPQVGDGTSPDTAFMPAVDAYLRPGETWHGYNNPARGVFFVLVDASGITHSEINAHPAVRRVHPDVVADRAELRAVLNTPLVDFPAAWKTAVQTKLEALGVSTTWVTAQTTLRELLKHMLRVHTLAQIAEGDGRPLVIEYLKQNLDATGAQIPAGVRADVAEWLQSRGVDLSWANSATTVREVLEHAKENFGLAALRFAGEDF